MVLVAALVLTFFPRPAQARNPFQQFFRGLRRVTHFVVSLPERGTRWMGPVLGPIAASVITQNISAHHNLGRIFNQARRINDAAEAVEEQRRLTGQVRQMYRDEALSLRDYAGELEQARGNLRQQLAEHNISLHDYIERAVNIERMIETVNQTADRFETQANNLRSQDIIKMAGSRLAQNVMGEVKNIALDEFRNEVNDLVNPYILEILSGNRRGLDALVDIVLYGLPETDHKFDSDEFRQRVKDRIKQVLAENRANLEGNFAELVRQVVEEMENEAATSKDETTEQAEEAIERTKDNGKERPQSPYSADELAASLSEIPKDEHGCLPGYVWRRMSGVGCVQKDCAEVGAHYSYTQACICSFVNPKPGAKTKACQRPANYRACPSCVYACVGPDEECPAR